MKTFNNQYGAVGLAKVTVALKATVVFSRVFKDDCRLKHEEERGVKIRLRSLGPKLSFYASLGVRNKPKNP